MWEIQTTAKLWLILSLNAETRNKFVLRTIPGWLWKVGAVLNNKNIINTWLNNKESHSSEIPLNKYFCYQYKNEHVKILAEIKLLTHCGCNK